MKFTCNTQALTDAVNNVQRGVSAKATLPTLEGILLRAGGASLYLAGYDLELGITTTIEASVVEAGEAVIPAKFLGEIVRRLPGDMLTMSVDDKQNVLIVSGRSEFTIMGLDPTEYPELPTVEDGIGLALPQNVLRSMIRQTLFAVAQTNARPTQTGVLFELEDGNLRLVAVDGSRLAMRNEKIDCQEKMSFIVPGKTLNELLKLLTDEDSPVSVAVGRRHVIFSVDGYSAISRLIDGEFLSYRKAVEQPSASTIRVKTRELTESVDRALLVINDKVKSPLICTFSKDQIHVYCSTSLGKVSDKISADSPEVQEEIGFNGRFLLDALRNTETDEVRVQINDGVSPVKILPPEGEGFLFLVMPVRLKNS